MTYPYATQSNLLERAYNAGSLMEYMKPSVFDKPVEIKVETPKIEPKSELKNLNLAEVIAKDYNL